MQSNQSELNNLNVINKNVYNNITLLIKCHTYNNFINEMQILSKKYNIDINH